MGRERRKKKEREEPAPIIKIVPVPELFQKIKKN